MTMKKKLLTTLSVVLILGMAALGILAYLTSEDSDVNVMTLGNVSIEQIEQEWNENGDALKDFKQAKPLYPYVGSLGWAKADVDNGAYRTFTMNNVVDKYVSVKNTGKSEVYVRTVFAFEMGDYANVEEFRNKIVGFSRNAEDGDEFDFPGAWVWETPYVEVIDGHNYMIWEAVHQDKLAPGETTVPSLLQVYMNPACGNDEVAKVDGNGNGTYDILVLSQGVQAAGFEGFELASGATYCATVDKSDASAAQVALDTAFGTVEDYEVIWFTEMLPVKLASTAAEFKSALAAGGTIVLGDDITLDSATTVNEAVKIDLNGHTLSTVGLDLANGGAIEDGTIESAGNTNLTPHLKISGGSVVMDNVTVDVNHHLNANVYWTEATGMEVVNATAVLNNCNIDINNQTKAQWVYSYGISLNNAELTMNGGSITAICIAGTAANGPTNPNAISTMGVVTATLNNVNVDATYYATTVNGHLTLNTTDKTVTSANIVDNRDGSHTLNYID